MKWFWEWILAIARLITYASNFLEAVKDIVTLKKRREATA